MNTADRRSVKGLDEHSRPNDDLAITKGETMQAVRIKQIVTQDGIMIPFNTVQRFQGKRVDIIILPDVEVEPPPLAGTLSLKTALADVFEQYHDVEPYKNIDPLQWERNIRNEW